MNLMPLIALKTSNSPACQLRRNSISMPALNNIDLEALRQAHMDSNNQHLENVSVRPTHMKIELEKKTFSLSRTYAIRNLFTQMNNVCGEWLRLVRLA